MPSPSRMWSRILLPVGAFALAFLSGCRGADHAELVLDRGVPYAPVAPATSRRKLPRDGAYAVEFKFRSFDNEALSAVFEINKSTYDAEDEGWGYRDSDIAGLRSWRDAARQEAYEAASMRHDTQEKLDSDLTMLQEVYRRKFKEYFTARGFIVEPGGVTKVNLAGLARRSAPKLSGLARELEKSAKGRGREWLIAAATSLVQTAVDYKEVPPLVDSVHTGGVWTPAKTLVGGWGDCDTKVALLAAIMANWPGFKMIIIELPDHFLLGYERPPANGESYIAYNGDKYVLIEAAGPAWLPPGYLGDDTKLLFESGRGYVIDPLF